MGSFVPFNVSICGILNFSGRGKCSTPTVNEDSVCCTRASMETGARPFISYLHVADFLLDVPEPLLPRPLLVAILSEGLVRIMLPGVASFTFSIRFSTRVEVLFFSGNRVLVFSGLSCLLGVSYLPGELFQLFQQVLVVTRSASTSSVLACTVSNAPPGGLLSTPPAWSCIL